MYGKRLHPVEIAQRDGVGRRHGMARAAARRGAVAGDRGSAGRDVAVAGQFSGERDAEAAGDVAGAVAHGFGDTEHVFEAVGGGGVLFPRHLECVDELVGDGIVDIAVDARLHPGHPAQVPGGGVGAEQHESAHAMVRLFARRHRFGELEQLHFRAAVAELPTEVHRDRFLVDHAEARASHAAPEFGDHALGDVAAALDRGFVFVFSGDEDGYVGVSGLRRGGRAGAENGRQRRCGECGPGDVARLRRKSEHGCGLSSLFGRGARRPLAPQRRWKGRAGIFAASSGAARHPPPRAAAHHARSAPRWQGAATALGWRRAAKPPTNANRPVRSESREFVHGVDRVPRSR